MNEEEPQADQERSDNLEQLFELTQDLEGLYAENMDVEGADKAITEAFQIGRDYGRIQGSEIYWRDPQDTLPNVRHREDSRFNEVLQSETVLVVTVSHQLELAILEEVPRGDSQAYIWKMPKGRTFLVTDRQPYVMGWMPVNDLIDLAFPDED